MKYKIKIIKENIYLISSQMEIRRKEMYRRFNKWESLKGKEYEKYKSNIWLYDVDEAFELWMMSENHYKDMSKFLNKKFYKKLWEK